MTGGGLRWIRYRFINEQQAGTAVAVSYRAVSICKAGRTRGGGGGWLEIEGAQREFQKSVAASFSGKVLPPADPDVILRLGIA